MRRLISQSTVQSLPIVEFKVPPQSFSGLTHNPVFLKVDLFVFHRPPQPLYKNIVIDPASTIHTDPNLRCHQLPKKLRACKLDPLVRIENPWLRDIQGSLQRPNAESRIQRRRKLPSQHIPTAPVHHRHQIQKSANHANIRDVRAPNLIRSINNQVSKQIRVLPMLSPVLAQPRSRVNRFQPHSPHQSPDPLRIHPMPLTPQPRRHPMHPVKGSSGKLLIDQVHQAQVITLIPLRTVVKRRSVEA